jgi:hypothetical protein
MAATRNLLHRDYCEPVYNVLPRHTVSEAAGRFVQQWHLFTALLAFYLKRKPVPGGRRRRLRNAEKRNLYPSINISVTKSTRTGQSALVAVMGQTINAHTVTGGKPQCTSPLAAQITPTLIATNKGLSRPDVAEK